MRWLTLLLFVSTVVLGGCDGACTSKTTNLWVYCKKQWSCDHGEYQVKCTPFGNGLSCTCKEDGKEVGSFNSSGFCDDATLSNLTVGNACGWDL